MENQEHIYYCSAIIELKKAKSKEKIITRNPGACMKHRKFHKRCPADCIHRNSLYLCCKKHKKCSPIECLDFEELSALILLKLKKNNVIKKDNL